LPVSARLVLTAFLAIVGAGYLVATANIYERHGMADGKPGLTVDDIRAVYSGMTVRTSGPAPSRMLTMVSGAMRQYVSSEEDFATLTTWLKAGGSEAGLDGATERDAKRQATRKSDGAEEGNARGKSITEPDGAPGSGGAGSAKRQAVGEGTGADANDGNENASEKVSENGNGDGKKNGSGSEKDGASTKRKVKVRTARRVLVRDCLRCHSVGGEGDIAKRAPFGKDEFDVDYGMVAKYAAVPKGSAGERRRVGPQYDLPRLVLVSHQHMLAIPVFTLVVGGLFLCTRIAPRWRAVLLPLPMLASVVDFSGWWLARVNEGFVYAIAAAGAVFGAGLGLQIVLVVLDMWGVLGRRKGN